MNLNSKIELEFIKNLTWPEVFEVWRQNEENRENWKQHYTERGFDSWEEWRMKYAEPFRCAEAKWALYKITNPVRDIVYFYGGPFRSWKERFYKQNDTLSFEQLADLSEIQQHGGTNEILNNFPENTILTGMVADKQIYIIEGMHRSSALALMNKRGLNFTGEVYIALAESPGGKLPIIGGFKKGKE